MPQPDDPEWVGRVSVGHFGNWASKVCSDDTHSGLHKHLKIIPTVKTANFARQCKGRNASLRYSQVSHGI